MSGGNFLVSLREIEISEKIIKLKSLIKQDNEWDQLLTKNEDLTEEMMTVIDNEILDINSDCLVLDTDAQEVAVHISGYVAKQLKANTGLCCDDLLVGNTAYREYLNLLLRGGLQIPSQALCD